MQIYLLPVIAEANSCGRADCVGQPLQILFIMNVLHAKLMMCQY
jgi:hypothetical protein